MRWHVGRQYAMPYDDPFEQRQVKRRLMSCPMPRPLLSSLAWVKGSMRSIALRNPGTRPREKKVSQRKIIGCIARLLNMPMCLCELTMNATYAPRASMASLSSDLWFCRYPRNSDRLVKDPGRCALGNELVSPVHRQDSAQTAMDRSRCRTCIDRPCPDSGHLSTSARLLSLERPQRECLES